MTKGTNRAHVLSPTHKKKYLIWLNLLDDDAYIKQNMVDYYKANPVEKCGAISPDVSLHRYRAVE